ncbi:MAG: hypothetical protein KC501_20585 [Myxococcales bacterium]|nr:hypothetical protein [Myxococcales bacterium]
MSMPISLDRWLVLSGLVTGLVAGACAFELPNHCSNNAGDATCQERGLGQYCDACSLVADGCSDTIPGSDCHFVGDPGVESSSSGSDDSSSDSGAQGSDTNTDSATDDMTATTEGPCMGNEDCPDAAAPLCDATGECVSCDAMAEPDAACAGLDPTTPVCDAGECVQCTDANASACGDTTPICDVDVRTCVGCSSHEQCPESACHEAEGSCLPTDAVWVVDRDGGADFTSVGEALGQIPADGSGTIIVRNSAMAYSENVVVGEGRVVAVIAETISEATRPRLSINSAAPILQVSGAAVVYLDGIELRGNTLGAGVEIDGSTIYVDRCELVANNQGGLVAGMGSEVIMRNVTAGGDINNVPAVQASNATVDVLYSTLAAGFGASSALSCSGGSVEVRNSIMVSESADAEIQCPGALVTYSAAESAIAGDGNMPVGNLDTAWFMNYGQGNLRLSASGENEFQGVALREAGDPPTDLDGDARPQMNGAMDFAGADVP